jgi:hypothetical protein
MRTITTRPVARALAGTFPAWITALALSLAPACDDDPGPAAGPQGAEGDAAVDPSPGGDGNGNGSSSNGAGDELAATGLPCDVAEALSAACVECHGDELRFGAPMPLTSYDALQAPAPTDESRATWELVGERIHSTTDPMPPAPFELDPEHEAALTAWVEAGAPVADEGQQCAFDPGSGGSPVPIEELPCGEPDHTFLASGNGPDGAYPVPQGGDGNFYICFPFPSPFEEGEQITAMKPLLDQEEVLHHYILWETESFVPLSNEPFNCSALPTNDSTFVSGWAPGGRTQILPDNVGFRTKPNTHYLLQVHYWNVAGHNLFDKSGVGMCSTTEPREHNAGVIGVGPILLNIPPRSEGVEYSAGCPGFQTLFTPGFTILGSSPHAHQFATRFKTEIVRASGETELLTLVDPWDFENQTGYIIDPPIRIEPGDGVKATCTYDNPTDETITWGENTEDEMCFDFMTIYPIEPWEDLIGFCPIPM